LRVFRSISLTFCTLKEAKLVFRGLNALFSGSEVANHPFYSIGTKMMFGSVSEHFANLRHEKDGKLVFRCLNALFRGTEVANHPFYSIVTKMIFGSVSEHFVNLRHEKDAKLVFRARMHSIGPKMIFGCVQSISLTFRM
jgi:hypothetical protein